MKNDQTTATPFSGGRYDISERAMADLERRFTFHAPTGAQVERYRELRAAALNFSVLLSGLVPPSRELSTALTHLDAVMMFANAGIARNEYATEERK